MSRRRNTNKNSSSVTISRRNISEKNIGLVVPKKKAAVPATCSIDLLPTCIFLEIREFLSFKCFRNLLNSSIELFAEIKYETVYFDLNSKYSFEYATKASFRKGLLSHIKNRSKQISIDLKHVNQIPSRLNVEGVHQCHISYTLSREQSRRPLDMGIFSGIDNLSLMGFNRTTSFQGMENVRKLKIEDFQYLTDIKSLSNLQELKIINCKILSDVSCLGNIASLRLENLPSLFSIQGLGRKNHSLALIDCPNICDVSMLSNLHTLNIIRCAAVKDVKALGKIFTLNLTDCPLIDDVRCLGGHDTLILGPCDATDYSSLVNVKCLILIQCKINSLNFYSSRRPLEDATTYPAAAEKDGSTKFSFMALYCEEIFDLTYLQYMQNVTIGGNDNITDVSMLGNVLTVNLMGCASLQSLNGLGKKNQRVSLSECDLIFDFSPLNSVCTVEIVNCLGFTNSQHVSGVENLLLQSCINLTDVSHLSNVKHLKLIKCGNITELKNLGRVRTLEIKQCSSLKNIKALGENWKVVIENCNSLRDISSLRTVNIVKIWRCMLINDVDILEDTVPHLEFEPAEAFPFGFFNFLFF